MTNFSSNNSKLVLYLIIILVLLYAITFMSYRNTQNDMFENISAPALSPNDFTMIAIGYANQLYIQDIINNVWNPNTTVVQNSQSAIDVAVYPDGSLISVGTDNKIYTRQTLNSSWVLTNITGTWVTVSIMNDGKTLLLVGKDSHIYTFDSSNNNNGKPPQMMGDDGGVYKIIQLQDKSFLIVGGGGFDTLYTTTNPVNGWNIASKPGIGITSVAQTPSGQIIGIGPSGFVYTKGNDWNTWNKTPCGNFSTIAVMPIPPQIINGYERKGAFMDTSSRLIPNIVGTFNTLPECINAAQAMGYNTVGFQFMNQCLGGNDSPYDSAGFQTDNTKSVSAYPGAWTNIVYKTEQDLVSTSDPIKGEVFVYQACQFTGSGSKMTLGQFPNLNDSITIKSVKLGPNTDLILYSQPNFQGKSYKFNSYNDIVNKNASCIDFTFSSAQVINNPNALPGMPTDLTNSQLATLWTQAGCKAESVGFNQTNINNWKNKNTINDVISDMKNWATSPNPEMKQGCYTIASQENIPGEGEVVLFENCNYTGKYKKFSLGNITFVGNDFNKITSSIKIGPFTGLTIYSGSNFQGNSLSWKNDSNVVSDVSCLTENNFDNMLSSLKISSSTSQVNFNLSLQASPVFTLGPYNMAPWNLNTFIDTTAKWIWWNQWCGGPKSISCNGSAPIDTKPVKFQLLVPVSSKVDIPVTIHVIADNAPKNASFVKLNNQLIGQILDGGWTTSKYTQIETKLAPGSNLVEFDVQNVGGGAGLLVSIINSDTFEVVANSGNGKWAWVDPEIVVSSIMAEEETNLIIHDETAKGKIVNIKDLKEIPQLTVGGVFRLVVNLKNVPPYIKGQQYESGDINQFYLSIEKLDYNCKIQTESNCLNIYVDNKKCENASLSNITKNNSYRLVLISKDYVLDPNIPFGKNVDFTMVKINGNYYLKNIQTGYMPKLFTNNDKQDIYGYMDTTYLSNYKSLKPNVNKTCNEKISSSNETTNKQNFTSPEQKFVKCSTNSDGTMYLMTTSNVIESNPLKFTLNKDGSVNISLETFNLYGQIERTFSLIYCNFNVDTYAFIEKLTNPLGTFLVNLVCFDSDEKRRLPNNTLNFNFEISKYPESYIKQKNILDLNY